MDACELRYDKKRVRAFRIVSTKDEYIGVKMSHGRSDHKSIPELIKYWGPKQIYLNVATNEMWAFDLTREQVSKKLTDWRARCQKDNLNNVANFNFQ